MNIPILSVLAILIAGAPVFGQTTPEERIRSLREQFNAAIARHDAEAVASFLDARYHITVGSGDLNWGGRAEEWAEVFTSTDDVIYVRTPESVDVSSSGDRAAEIGSWVGSWTTPGGPQQVGGRYAAHWQRMDGGWKIRSELFVTLSCEGPECS